MEDKRFTTGKGKYTDDIVLPNMTHAYIVRSPYAHARIRSIDTKKAAAHKGVVAIFTGQDIAMAKINGVPCGWQVNFKNGDTMHEPPHPLLVADKARHVGDGIAIVIAENRYDARDAADLVEVEYEVLDAVVSPRDAADDSSPRVHDDLPNNLAFDWSLGNPIEEVNRAIDSAHHVTTLRICQSTNGSQCH